MKGNLKRPDFRELMNPLLRTTAGILFFSWFFYRSVFAIILFIFPGILYFRKCVREQREKKRWELTVQFKECLLAVANSLRTGYAVENAFLEIWQNAADVRRFSSFRRYSPWRKGEEAMYRRSYEILQN